MQQSKKKQSDKTNNEKILLEVLLDWKTGSLRDLTANLAMCKLALKKYGYIHNEVSLFYNLYKNKSLLNDWNHFCSSNIKNLDVNTTKGQLELKSCFSLVKGLTGNYYKDKNKDFSHLQQASMLLGSYNYKNLQIKDIITFFKLEQLLRGAAFEAIGYWTAKLEKKKGSKEGGGKAVKEQGDKNKEAIRKVIADLEITSLTVFRKDKELRNNFYKKSKEKTSDERYKPPVSLSEKRISDIARAILKEQGAGLDTKPPL